MNMYGEVEVQSHTFLTSALEGGEWSNSHIGRFNSGGEITRFPLDSGLAGPLTRSRRCEEKRRLLSLSRTEPQPTARSFADWAIPASQ
jgi:hypothetical protein